MLATVLNAVALQDALERGGLPTRVLSALDVAEVAEPYIRRRAMRHLEKNRIVVFAAGTGNPFFTTDTGAALRACEIGAQALLMAKNGVDGVYDADPATTPDARFLPEVSHREALERQLRVMDATALSLCMDNDMPIYVFNIDDAANIGRVVRGERHRHGREHARAPRGRTPAAPRTSSVPERTPRMIGPDELVDGRQDAAWTRASRRCATSSPACAPAGPPQPCSTASRWTTTARRRRSTSWRRSACPTRGCSSITPYDKSAIKEIERAVLESDLGLNPANDGNVVRLPIPQLTEDRRKDLVKVARHIAEEGRIAVRNVRRDALHHLKELERAGEVAGRRGAPRRGARAEAHGRAREAHRRRAEGQGSRDPRGLSGPRSPPRSSQTP